MLERETKDKGEHKEAKHGERVQPVHDELKQAVQPEDSQGKQSLAEMPVTEQVSLVRDRQVFGAQRAKAMLNLQQSYGNAYVQRIIERIQAIAPRIVLVAPLFSVTPVAMEDKGKTGTEILEGELAKILTETTSLKARHISQAGLLDVLPHVFVNGGKTGTAVVHWAGGGGGVVNQACGDITLVPPVIDTKDPEGEGGVAKAWVRPGTGTATVTRSYVGVLVGANGTYYITSSAATRIDTHEGKHISNSKGHHDTYIVPLETRIAQYTGEANAMTGATKGAAKTALETFINWNNTITNFQTKDTTDNTPGGTVDTTDQASGSYPVDYGPRTVGNTNYAHYVDTPPGPGP